MTDNNQQTIEVLEELRAELSRNMLMSSADIVKDKIDELMPKDPYIAGGAYQVKLYASWETEQALYLGNNQWAVRRAGWPVTPLTYCCIPVEATPLVDPTRPEIVSTSAELAALPANTIVRRRVDEDKIYDVAVVNHINMWYRDSTERATSSSQMATEGPWEVVSRG